jgi:hypothetical protein
LSAPTAFPQRHHKQDAPETFPVVDVESASPVPLEERTKDGLEHVLGIDLGSQGGVEMLARDGQDLAREPVKDLGRHLIVAGTELSHQTVKGIGSRHGHASKTVDLLPSMMAWP